MTGLSKITDKILAEARADAERSMAEAEERCREIGREYAARAEEIRARMDEDARRQAEEIVSRAKSDEAMIRRTVALETQSRMVDEAFDLAKREILNLSNERYLEFLVMLLGGALRKQSEDEKISRELYGEADAPAAEHYEVLLNERDRDRCGKALLERIQKAKDVSTAGRLVLAEETVAIDGGLVLRMGNVEINCSVKALFDALRPEWEGRVHGRLFAEKRS